MTATVNTSLRLVTCRDACPWGPARRHHDRLLRVDTDPDVLLELFELATTWHELDYANAPFVPPAGWASFAASHHWTNEARAVRAFALATDIVERSAARAGRRGGTLLDVPPAPR